ncbi:MAG: four helix bundle protein [Bacteroidales bacterium]|nr:four helix bundle protein [Bacteroidales bacterium]
MTLSSFEDLDIWKEARELAKVIRNLTRNEKFSKDFRFVAQITSSSGSTMDNVAEGFERDGHKEFIQFLYIAKASNGECRSQAYRAFDASFINQEELDDILSRTSSIRNKTQGLIKYLKNSQHKGTKYKQV